MENKLAKTTVLVSSFIGYGISIYMFAKNWQNNEVVSLLPIANIALWLVVLFYECGAE